MNRLLLIALLALLPFTTHAQTPINLSVTYSTGAAAAAAAQGTTVAAKVQARIDLINSVYAGSAIGVSLTPVTVPAVNPPADSAPMSAQYTWVHNSPQAWQQRTNAEASISIHISDTSGAAGAEIALNQPATAVDSVIAVPYGYIDTALEYAISRIIGSGDGYNDRLRSYPTDPYLAGQNYCYHSRESAPSNPSALIPFLPFWSAYTPLGSPITQTQSATNTATCEAFRLYQIANGGSSTTYATATVTLSNGNYTCSLKDNHGTTTAGSALIYNSNPGSDAISCGENTTGIYAKIGTMANWPYRPLGNSTHNSVGPMNAHAFDLSLYPSLNATITSRKKAGFWSGVWSVLSAIF